MGVLEPPSPTPYVPAALLDMSYTATAHAMPIQRCKWHRIFGWRGRTAYRPRHRERLKALERRRHDI